MADMYRQAIMTIHGDDNPRRLGFDHSIRVMAVTAWLAACAERGESPTANAGRPSAADAWREQWYAYACRKFGVASKSTIRSWVAKYLRVRGADGERAAIRALRPRRAWCPPRRGMASTRSCR